MRRPARSAGRTSVGTAALALALTGCYDTTQSVDAAIEVRDEQAFTCDGDTFTLTDSANGITATQVHKRR